jgi:hypothetical protein
MFDLCSYCNNVQILLNAYLLLFTDFVRTLLCSVGYYLVLIFHRLPRLEE